MHFWLPSKNAKPRNLFFLCRSIGSTVRSSMSIRFCVKRVSWLCEKNQISFETSNFSTTYTMKRYNIEDINILMITFIIELSNIGPALWTVMEQLNANLAANYHNYSFSDGAIILSIGEVNTSKPSSSHSTRVCFLAFEEVYQDFWDSKNHETWLLKCLCC